MTSINFSKRMMEGVIALASPIWLPWLQTVSELAALLLPIAGLVWIKIQAYYFLRGKK